jgi:ribosome-associated toxin RatA of RatAB toxin-antitoxin module
VSEVAQFSREDLYAVVADVESYTEFVPFCSTSSVVSRHGPGSFDAELAIDFLAFSERYTSRVTAVPPSSVTAIATDTALFEHLHSEWRFDEGSAPGTCELHFSLDLLLKSIVHDKALRLVIDRVAAQQVSAFRERCALLARSSQQQQQQQQRRRRRRQQQQQQQAAAAEQPEPPAPVLLRAAAATRESARGGGISIVSQPPCSPQYEAGTQDRDRG